MEMINRFYKRSQLAHLRDFIKLCEYRSKLSEETNDCYTKALNEKLKRYATVVLKKLERDTIYP